MTITDFPVALVPVDPYARLIHDALGPSGSGKLKGSGGTAYDIGLLLTYMGVDLQVGAHDHMAYYLVFNFLDRPLTVSDFYEGHGYQYMQPAIVDIPVNAPDNPVSRIQKVIPGQTEAMIPDTPIPNSSEVCDVDAFGVGLFMTGKDGPFRGTEAAIALTTSDARVTTPIALAGCITSGGGSLYRACTLDYSSYGTLEGFHDATVDNDKTIIQDSAGGVRIASQAGYYAANTGGGTFSDGFNDIAVFAFFIGPDPT